jgi:cation diffusion facilitator CzcD-associated flavoprotein CzcO
VRVAIVGAGFAGLGMAIRLRQAGYSDFVVLERAAEVGGTWRDNSYPGAAVDVRSHLYSYSFAPNPDWTQVLAGQAELWDYIRRVAREHGVGEHVRLETELLGGTWDDAAQRWRLRTSQGELEAQFVVSAMGPLSRPRVPDLPGPRGLHGARLPLRPLGPRARPDRQAGRGHRHGLVGGAVRPRDRRPGGARHGLPAHPALDLPAAQPADHPDRARGLPPGPGAAAAGPRAPVLVPRARHRVGRPAPRCHRDDLQGPAALGRARPRAAEKLTPTYRMGCKRIVINDTFLPALTRPDVDLVTDPIVAVTPTGVRTADGTEHPVDTLVLGTGYSVMPVADPLRGREGDTLHERWAERRTAHLGTSVAGFPNYFMLVGPNTATGHTSILLYAEPQIEYVLQVLRHADRHGIGSFEVRQEAQDAYNAALTERLKTTVWTTGGCDSWYLDERGGTSVLWPGFTWSFRKALKRFDHEHYVMRRAPADR